MTAQPGGWSGLRQREAWWFLLTPNRFAHDDGVSCKRTEKELRMAMTKCKECKKEVSSKAATCPHCGIKNPGQKASDAIGGFIMLIVIGWIISLFMGGDNKTAAEASLPGTAQPYTVLSKQDISVGNRDRLRWVITAPQAITLDDRAATAVQAAKDLQSQTGADLADVWLEVGEFSVGQGRQLAQATYIPDGCGNSGQDCGGEKWQVRASDLQLTEQQIAIWKAWYQERGKFQVNGLTNEDRLKAHLAKRFGVPVSQIGLPFMDMQKVAIQ
jgi:Zn finger protein HypA/HybF involved in hydrogenase expression